MLKTPHIILAVSGGRHKISSSLVYSTLYHLRDEYIIDKIVTSGSQGSETYALEWALLNNVPAVVYYPTDQLFGTTSPQKRDQHIVDESTFFLSFSTETTNILRKALRKQKKIGSDLYKVKHILI